MRCYYTIDAGTVQGPVPLLYRSFAYRKKNISPHLWCINRIAYRLLIVNLQSLQVLIIYCINLTRRLTRMIRGLIDLHSGSNNAQTHIQAAERDRGRTPKRLSGRLRDRSALDFSFSFGCGAGVCLSRRAQRADLYKTSTRHGAKGQLHKGKRADCTGLYLAFVIIEISR